MRSNQSAVTTVFEGSWEEVSQRADEFAGRRVRLVVLPNEEHLNDNTSAPFHETATADEWVAEFSAWAHTPRNAPPLSDAAISRESIYSERLDKQL